MTRIRGRRGGLPGALVLTAAGFVLAAAGDILQDELWVNVFDGGVGTDYIAGVAIDSGGNVVGAEYMAATPGSDGALVRWLRNGTVDWVDVLDNTASDTADSKSGDSYAAVCVDADDNVIVGGTWSGDYYAGDYFHNTAIVRKYDAGGHLAWEWKGDSSYEAWASVRSVATDAGGNVHAAGNAFISWGANQHDWAIWKFDPGGTLQSGFPLFYNHSQLYTVSDVAYGIAVHTDGSFVAVGQRGVADNADPNRRDIDWHVRKYNADRSLAWEDTFSGAANLSDCARAVAIDPSGDVYVAGYTNVGTDNGTGADWDGLVIKYGRDTGERLWTQTASSGAHRNDQCLALTIGPGRNVLALRVESEIGTTLNENALDLLKWSDGALAAREFLGSGVNAVGYGVAYRDGLIALGGYAQGPTSLDSVTALYAAAAPPNTLPEFDDAPSAGVALAAVGEVVKFHATATDEDGDPLTLAWSFGDGATGAGTDPEHAYTTAGTKHVSLMVSDGKAFITGPVDVVVGEPIQLPSVTANVDFRKPGRDTLTLSGRIALPAGFVPTGRELTVDAGGVARTFVLDKKGRARTPEGRVTMAYLKKKALWTLNVTLAKGSYAAAWEDEGLTNRTVRKEPVTMKATVDISGEFRCAHLVHELYTAKLGRTGAAK